MVSSYGHWVSASSFSLLNVSFLCNVGPPGIKAPRRVTPTHRSLPGVENPKLVLIVGCVGFALNVISATFLHGKQV